MLHYYLVQENRIHESERKKVNMSHLSPEFTMCITGQNNCAIITFRSALRAALAAD